MLATHERHTVSELLEGGCGLLDALVEHDVVRYQNDHVLHPIASRIRVNARFVYIGKSPFIIQE